MKLTQKRLLFGTQTFELTGDDQLLVSTKGWGGEKRFKVPLASLDPEPARIRTRPIFRWALAALLGTLFGGVVLLGVWSPDGGEPVSPGLFGIILGAFFVAFLRSAVLETVNVMAFYDRFSGRPLLTPWFNNPNAKTFDDAMRELRNRISRLSGSFIATEPNVEAQLRSLHRLRDEGLLTPEEFEVAKRRALGAGEKAAIGFRAG